MARHLAGVSGGGSQSPLDTKHDFRVGLFTILMIAIIFMTLVFETTEHAAMGVAQIHKEIHDSIYHDVLIRIKDELMILGLISFVLVFLEESMNLSNEDLHTFHYAHLVVFMVACTYAIQGGFVIYYTKTTRYRWRKAEHDVRMAVPTSVSRRRSPSMLPRRVDSWLRSFSSASLGSDEDLARLEDQGSTSLNPYTCCCRCVLRCNRRLMNNLHFFFNKESYMSRFRVIRRMFAAMYLEKQHAGATGFASSGDSARRADFDFAVYLTLSLRRNAIDFLEIRKTSWIAFSVVIGLNWIRYILWLEISDSDADNGTEVYLSNDNEWTHAYYLVGVGLFVLVAQIALILSVEDGTNLLLHKYGPQLLLQGRQRQRSGLDVPYLDVLERLLRATKRKDKIDARNMAAQNLHRKMKKTPKKKDFSKHMIKKKGKSVSFASKSSSSSLSQDEGASDSTNRSSGSLLSASSSTLSPSPPTSPAVPPAFVIGANVQIVKQGNQKGRGGKVLDPHWHDRVKIEMFQTREIKSYLAEELVLVEDVSILRHIREGILSVGDDVRVVKIGTQYGKVATVTDPTWNGRIKLRMYDTGQTKSYLSHELELVKVHSSPGLDRKMVDRKRALSREIDGDLHDDEASKRDGRMSPERRQHHTSPHHRRRHHRQREDLIGALDAYYATQAKGISGFFFQCFRHILTGHDHDNHGHSAPIGCEDLEWRRSGFFFKNDGITFRVMQGLSLIQALFTLLSILTFMEMLTVDDPKTPTVLVVSFALSTIALLAVMNFGTMPALFERYTLLQSWAMPNFELIVDTKSQIKSREAAMIELIRRLRRRIESTHIEKNAMREIFLSLDSDNSGRLERREIAFLLVDMFGNISRARLAALVKLFDPLGNGCTYEMFAKVLYDGNSVEIGKSFARRETVRRRSFPSSGGTSHRMAEILENNGELQLLDDAPDKASKNAPRGGSPGARGGSGIELRDIGAAAEGASA